jgi:hypothetical protein
MLVYWDKGGWDALDVCIVLGSWGVQTEFRVEVSEKIWCFIFLCVLFYTYVYYCLLLYLLKERFIEYINFM